MLLFIQAQQPRAQHRPRAQIERTPCLLLREPSGLLLTLRPLQSLHHQRHRRLGGDALHRLPFDLHEGRPQRFVPAHHLRQRALQR